MSPWGMVFAGYGMQNAMAGGGKFPNGVSGMVLNLEEDNIGCVILDYTDIQEEDEVKRTGHYGFRWVTLIGRVVNPLGEPLDGEPIKTDTYRAVESSARYNKKTFRF